MNTELKKAEEAYAAQKTDNEENKSSGDTVANENANTNEMKTEMNRLNEQISILEQTVQTHEKEAVDKTDELSTLKSHYDGVKLENDQVNLEKEELLKKLALAESLLAKYDIKTE